METKIDRAEGTKIPNNKNSKSILYAKSLSKMRTSLKVLPLTDRSSFSNRLKSFERTAKALHELSIKNI